ncbi:hypothetical protein BDF22DRAFT_742626 [Syncephalis plumigaleata]|nr:hypothetical protein BDF22DRAFT_742626 [Syncephalis plumigaleata]
MDSTQPVHTYKAFEAYDFVNDTRFQAGLKNLLGKDTVTEEELHSIETERARWFYYNKFIEAFDYDTYYQWKQTRNEPQEDTDKMDKKEEQATSSPETTDSSAQEPAYPNSFQAICELIAAGKPVPGIRYIPDRLNEEPPSQSSMTPRPKPWEKSSSS